MIGAELEAIVPASAEAVWSLIGDTRRLPQWLALADEVEVLEGRGVGMKLRLLSRWRGRRSEVDVEVTSFEPNRVMAWRHLAERMDGKAVARFSKETRFAIWLEPLDTGTKVRLRAEQDPAGAVRGFFIKVLGSREALHRMALSLERLRMVAAIR